MLYRDTLLVFKDVRILVGHTYADPIHLLNERKYSEPLIELLLRPGTKLEGTLCERYGEAIGPGGLRCFLVDTIELLNIGFVHHFAETFFEIMHITRGLKRFDRDQVGE